MTHAIVLIEAEREAMPQLGGALADVEGVAEAWSVTGEWDFVAMLRVRTPEEIAEVVTGRLGAAAGHQADAHDGRLRGLLQARPRGAVLDRDVTSPKASARNELLAWQAKPLSPALLVPSLNHTPRSFQSCTISAPPATIAPMAGTRSATRPIIPAVASTAPVAP